MLPSSPGSPHVVIDIQYLESSMGRSSPVKPSPLISQPAASTNIAMNKPAGALVEADLRMGEVRTLMRVEEVEYDSLSDFAGLQVGDIVLAANGEALESTSDVVNVIGGASGTVCLQGMQGEITHIDKESSSTPIGLTVAPIAPVVVVNVDPNGLAAHAGLRQGDVLLSVNGEFCETSVHAAALIAQHDGELELEVRLPRPAPARSPRVLNLNGKVRRMSPGGSRPVRKHPAQHPAQQMTSTRSPCSSPVGVRAGATMGG